MTAAFKGGLTVKREQGGSPEVYTTIEEVKSLSGFGKVNPLIDATSFSSTAKEYIAGLADGQEVTIECLRVHASPSQQDALIADVNAGTNRLFQLVLTNGTTAITYTFTGTCLSWVISPSFDDANMISYTVKISGDITVS